MNRILIFFIVLLFPLTVWGQSSFSVVSWNIKHMGKSKNNKEIKFMASIVHDYDIIAIQEVVAKDPAGAKAVAKMADEMNRKGGRWDYRISNPTTSASAHKNERYAFIWNRNKIKLKGRPWLDKYFKDEITREPYFARFILKENSKEILVINFHSIPYNKEPESEFRYFKNYPKLYENETIIFAGDYNMKEHNTVFKPLKKMGYLPILKKQATTLRKKKLDKKGRYLLHDIDNIFYDSNKLELQNSYIVDFVPLIGNLEMANGISDHVPVVGVFKFLN